MRTRLLQKWLESLLRLPMGPFFLSRNVNRALSMLVIDFVCGIKLSTAALSAAIGKAE